MTEIEVEIEMLFEKMLFTDGCYAKAIQNDAGYSVLPSVGEEMHCLEAQLDGGPFSSDLKLLDNKIRPIEEQLQSIIRKAGEYQNRLIYSNNSAQNKSFYRVVPIFLTICKPYFNYLESTARNTSAGQSALSLYIRSKLLQLSQHLCSQLEQLVLAYALYGYISLADTDPMGVSHFYTGQCQIDYMKVSIFFYCQPTQFLALTSDRLYKRMRWNVEHEKGTEAGEAMEGELEEKRERKIESNSTEYYFLCYEDVQLVNGDVQTERKTGQEAVQRMWSIGKWVQIFPDPDTEDLDDWVLCTAPQGEYRPLVYLGGNEPSSCSATNCLLGVLLSQADENNTHPIMNKKSMSANQE